MMRFVLACLISLLAVPAFAQEPTKRGAFQTQTPDWYGARIGAGFMVGTTTDPGSGSLVVNAGSNAAAREIFRLGPNGCLRGPLKFFTDDGKVSFSLDDGAHYPDGCEKETKQ